MINKLTDGIFDAVLSVNLVRVTRDDAETPNAEYFISQSTKDALKEEDSGNFGVAFAFDEPNEGEEVLKWMNITAWQKVCLLLTLILVRKSGSFSVGLIVSNVTAISFDLSRGTFCLSFSGLSIRFNF